MPRTRRTSVGGYCYHVINRGNRKSTVFHDVSDHLRFLTLMKRANERIPIRLLAWCLMANHFHLVLWPRHDGDMSRWMHWLLTTHVRWHHLKYGTTGRIWQGRFKSFPIQQDEHLLTVMRYVERNPLRAGLVASAEEWPWSSLYSQVEETDSQLLQDGPVERWSRWLEYVNEPQTEAELKAVRNSVKREAPFGGEAWSLSTTQRLGLTWTSRNPGRPPALERKGECPH